MRTSLFMSTNKTPLDIVNTMMEKDAFSRWLGVQIEEISAGYARISMEVRKEMVNGFEVGHGGITFSLADSALAFASNSRGYLSLALENNINFTKRVSVGDVLTAETEELQNGRTIGVYKVSITNQNNDVVGEFRGTVYRSGEKY